VDDMAVQNLLKMTAMRLKTSYLTPSTTGNIVLLSNGSDCAIKIESILASNISEGTAICSVYLGIGVGIIKNPFPGTMVEMMKDIPIYSSSSMVFSDRATSFYLPENNCIVVSSSIANSIKYTITYEIAATSIKYINMAESI
jgi:hypothetical protein